MNGIIVVDKPQGWTSLDVCAKLRGVFREKRIGHGGTLDPMATGVLPVLVGRAARAAEYVTGGTKRYTAALRCGMTTDTQDITGTVLTNTPCDMTEERLLDTLPEFVGEQEQLPPMYSAVKINGKKLYEIARRGGSVERQPRTVTISEINYMGRDGEDFVLDIVCSKGTYIRTLCADIGERLGCGAVMSALRRTRAGAFTLENARTMDEIVSSDNAADYLLGTDTVFREYPAITLSARDEKKCRNGVPIKRNVRDGLYRVYSETGEFLMLGKSSGGIVKTEKSFYEV